MSEVIELNNHRLLNGDATNSKDVNKLISDFNVNLLLTDPPYGIDIVKTGGGQIGGQGGTAIRPFKNRERERERANGNNRRSKTTNLQQDWEQSEHLQNQASRWGGQIAYGKVGKPRHCSAKTL